MDRCPRPGSRPTCGPRRSTHPMHEPSWSAPIRRPPMKCEACWTACSPARCACSASFPGLDGPRPRGAILQMQPYEWEPPSTRIASEAGVPESNVVRFDTNTSPWPGVSLSDLGPLALNEYPDTSYSMLTAALAAYTWAPADAITVGAGADEILDMLAKAYVGAGDPVVLSRPTYAMFRIVSVMAGGRVKAVPPAGLHLDQDRVLKAAAPPRPTP